MNGWMMTMQNTRTTTTTKTVIRYAQDSDDDGKNMQNMSVKKNKFKFFVCNGTAHEKL